MQNLKGVIPDKAVTVIQQLADSLASLTTKFVSFTGQPLVTKPQADAAYGPAAQVKALQVSGSNPLNVTGLIGLLSQPQMAKAPAVPGSPTAGPNAQPGTVVTINNIINEVISPGVTKILSAAAFFLNDTHANRVANYPVSAYPTGTAFFETDSMLLLESNGVIWQTIAGQISDSHANRIANWPSVQFSNGTKFYETDRQVTYWVQNSTGTVVVSGSGMTVTWASGDHFINDNATYFNTAQWPEGTVININGLSCNLFSVTSNTVLTLELPIPTGTFSYSVTGGRWVYYDGEMQQAYANLPMDLGENDVVLDGSGNMIGGFLFYDNLNSLHTWQWTGTVGGWTWGPGNDAPSGEFGFFDEDPGTGWHLADGSTVTKYMRNATHNATFVLPNPLGAYIQANISYAGAPVAAHAPILTMDPYTPAGTIAGSGGFTGTSITNEIVTASNAPAMGGTGAVLVNSVGLADPGHSHTVPGGGTFTGTPAILTGLIDDSGTPVTFAMLAYYRI